MTDITALGASLISANGMQLFFAGKLKVVGNQMLAMKLSKLFAL